MIILEEIKIKILEEINYFLHFEKRLRYFKRKPEEKT